MDHAQQTRKETVMHQRILITGANRGIGLEMSRQSMAHGDRVTAGCRTRTGPTR